VTPRPPFAHSIAVVIGIDHYGNGVPALRTAVNDARHLGELLGTDHGYDVTAILDADASLERLTTLLTTELPARVGSDDRVLFYFAGHGVARDSDEGPNGYLLPVDARRGDDTTYLSMPLVHDALLALPCRHMLVVLDSCFSGAFRWSGTRDVEDVGEVIHREKYDRFVHDPAWQVITSASQDQKALDQLSAGALGTRDGDREHSPFAFALFDGLSGKGDVIPRDGGDGLVTATELYLYLDEALQSAVIAAGKSQTPRLWPLKKHDRGEFVFFVPNRELSLPPAPPLTFDNNPWRGLSSYDAAQSSLFFGREAETEALRAKIAAAPLTVVLGASGTGKSSLVKAGVVPRLVADGHQVLPIVRPGSTPMVAIAQALAAAAASDVAPTPEAITARVDALVSASPEQLTVLVVDQFEELITLVRTAEERDTVLTLLASLAERHARSLRIVVTIRTDFEPNFDRSAFGDRWRDGRYVIPPMSREKLRAVIEKPAAVRVLYFDPSNLVDTLLDEVVATPGALPLLSFALSEMYIAYVTRQSGDRAITRGDYDALGGVVGALRARAESEYASLDAAHQATLRRVMLRLVTVEGGNLARRRVMDAELDFADEGERTRAASVVQRLTAARLLVEGKEPDGEAFVEPAHDALVRGWGRLLEWVRDENDAPFPLVQQQKLARAAEEWDRSSGAGKAGLLWRDAARSAQLSPLVRRRAPFLNRREMAFAERSVRGRRVTVASVAAAVVTIAIAGVVATVTGLRASARAEQVRIASVVSTARSMVAEDPMIAGLLLGTIDSAAIERADNGTRLTILGTAYDLRRSGRVVATFNNDGDVFAAAISPDGRTVATAGAGGVQLWPADGRGLPRRWQADSVTALALAFSRDGADLVVSYDDGTVRVGRVDGADSVRIMRMRAESAYEVAFSPDGASVLAESRQGSVQVFTLARGRASDRGGPPPGASTYLSGYAATFADSGRAVVMGGRPVRLARITGPAGAPQDLNGAENDYGSFAVSPDGMRIAIGTRAGDVRIVSAQTGRHLQLLRMDVSVNRTTDNTNAVAAVAWSRDGTLLATASARGALATWDMRTGRQLAIRQGVMTRALSFSADTRWLLCANNGKLEPGVAVPMPVGPVVTLSGHTNEVTAVVFAPDGNRVLTAGRDGSVRLWELPQPVLYDPWRERAATDTAYDDASLTGAAFSATGTRVAFVSEPGVLSIARVDTAAPRITVDTVPRFGTATLAFTGNDRAFVRLDRSHAVAAYALASRITKAVRPLPPDSLSVTTLLPDGHTVVGISATGGTVVLWDALAPTPPRRIRFAPPDAPCTPPSCYSAPTPQLAVSADGQTMAATTASGSLHLFRLNDGAPLRTITGSAAYGALAFSPDGRTIAVSRPGGTVSLVPVTGADTGRRLVGHQRDVSGLDFTRDGRTLLSASTDGTVRVWSLAQGTSTLTVRPKGVIVDARFTVDGTRVLTLGGDQPEVRLWNVDGSGGSVALSVHGATVNFFDQTPDGASVLLATREEVADLIPLDEHRALQPFLGQRICLSVADRRRYLSETLADATARRDACETFRRRAPASAPR
jgi:WD40 repeat protein